MSFSNKHINQEEREVIATGKVKGLSFRAIAEVLGRVNHDRLMQRLKDEIDAPDLLRLINRYLKAGIQQDGQKVKAEHQPLYRQDLKAQGQ